MSSITKPAVSVMCPDTGGGSTVVKFPAPTPGGRTGAPVSKRLETARGLILNKVTAKKLSCPAGKAEHLYRDSEVRGFILRCYANGRRMWLVQYRDETGATRAFVASSITLLRSITGCKIGISQAVQSSNFSLRSQ